MGDPQTLTITNDALKEAGVRVGASEHRKKRCIASSLGHVVSRAYHSVDVRGNAHLIVASCNVDGQAPDFFMRVFLNKLDKKKQATFHLIESWFLMGRYSHPAFSRLHMCTVMAMDAEQQSAMSFRGSYCCFHPAGCKCGSC